MTEQAIPRAPLHLGPAGKRLWRRVATAYVLADWQLDILEGAAVAADRQAEARQILATDGLIVDGGKLGPKAHPAVSIEKESRLGMLRSLRELALSPDDVAEAPRPPSIAGRYKRTGS